MPYQREIRAIKMFQDDAILIAVEQEEINAELEALKARLREMTEGVPIDENYPAFEEARKKHLKEMDQVRPLDYVPLSQIFAEAEQRYKEPLSIQDILDADDFLVINDRLSRHVIGFNNRYSLDGWDYAIAGGAGLFAAMLDLLCVSAPPKPTTAWAQKVDGIFNQWTQEAFNKIFPTDFSKILSEKFKIGAPDASTRENLINAQLKVLTPFNHRLRALSHDPVLGVIFGVWDMMHGTCTVVVDGKITSFPSKLGQSDGNIFQLIGKMLGHLASDVNAPSPKGNRGMGLPAPFMGLLRMLEGIPIGDSNFGRQIEYMFLNGYDFRQFVVTSIPMAIMEILMRAFYVGKQVKLYNAPFGETILDTMPGKLNPRFRIMLALAYGTSSAVNAGKMYITQNILNANYASWLGLLWNGFHAMKWLLLDRQLKLWGEFEKKEIEALENTVREIEALEERTSRLPG